MSHIKKPRHGTTLVECIVAASILSVAIGTVTMAVGRISRIWADTRQYRIALHEVSNHLETLTQLPPDQVQTAIDSLDLSPTVERSLVDAKFRGELIQDDFGNRVTLALTWSDGRATRPIHMTAWLLEPRAKEKP
jgi:hypothetical protein